MTTIQAIAALIFAPTAIAAVIAYVLTKYFEKTLARDLENHKAQLQSQNDLAKTRLDNELASQLFTYQTKFSSYHNRRTEVISTVYGLLYETEQRVKVFVSPFGFSSDPPLSERLTDVANIYNQLADAFGKNRIFLDEQTGDQVEKVLHTVRDAIENYRLAQDMIEDRESAAEARKTWRAAWKSMTDDVPPLRKELERQFRQSLAAEIIQ